MENFIVANNKFHKRGGEWGWSGCTCLDVVVSWWIKEFNYSIFIIRESDENDVIERF